MKPKTWTIFFWAKQSRKFFDLCIQERITDNFLLSCSIKKVFWVGQLKKQTNHFFWIKKRESFLICAIKKETRTNFVLVVQLRKFSELCNCEKITDYLFLIAQSRKFSELHQSLKKMNYFSLSCAIEKVFWFAQWRKTHRPFFLG